MDYHLLNQAQNVPSLSATMLILLSLLLFIVAFKISKKRGSEAGKMFIVLIGVSAITSGIGGVKLISEAQAVITEYPLIVAADGTGHVDRSYFNTTHPNPNTQAVIIDFIETCDAFSLGDTVGVLTEGKQKRVAAAPAPTLCAVGDQVAPGASCKLNGCPR